MKQGRMQAKDIDDRRFLRIVDDLQYGRIKERHGPMAPYGYPVNAMSWDVADHLGVDLKLANAKAEALIKRGLLDGCSCGCRGDYELTTEGTAFLETEPREQAQAASSGSSDPR